MSRNVQLYYITMHYKCTVLYNMSKNAYIYREQIIVCFSECIYRQADFLTGKNCNMTQLVHVDRNNQNGSGMINKQAFKCDVKYAVTHHSFSDNHRVFCKVEDATFTLFCFTVSLTISYFEVKSRKGLRATLADIVV